MRHEHPMGVGLENKLYDTCDYVTPLADSIRELHRTVCARAV